VRLSVVTDEIDEDLPRALDVCRDLGVTTVEVRSVGGRNVVEHSPASRARIARLIERHRVRVCAIASPFLKCDATEDLRGQWDQLERAVSMARDLGAPLVRGFSFWRAGGPGAVGPQLVDALRTAADVAAEAGLRLVIENEHSCNVATGAEAAAILDACRPAVLSVIWDPANEARLAPHLAHGVAGYDAVRPHVAHVHLKDVDAHGRWVRIGSGIVDHAALLTALQRDGYAGSLSVETHHTVGGSRETATRQCVASLRAIAERAGVAVS
jgi:sugar phosphate isomerase/epimerase